MPSIYKVYFDDKVIKDLKKIDKTWQIKIIDKIETTLTINPYNGKKLVGDLSNYYRLRVEDYRVIYKVINDTISIEIIKIKHRKDIYS